ncbi:MAG: AbiV family abortive infection protein [Candidatus Eisenbacteria bacterium]|nr:AbiV family abortive infection protein [Candidatus Eisenbacteria bacterium]
MKRIEESVRAILQNARRLLDDAEFLKLNEPPATGYYLSLIAQEECAKAFLLALVQRQVIPWNQHILRASRDHTCKQLLCVIMEFLNPELEEFIERCNARGLRHELPRLPPRVADAMNILRHEKIGRWISRNWVWAEDPEYDKEARDIAEGERDRQKQDALYVRLAPDGGLAAVRATMTNADVTAEMERAARMAGLVDRLLEGDPHPGLDYAKVEEAFRLLFTEPPAVRGDI